MRDSSRFTSELPRNTAKLGGSLLPANLTVLSRTAVSLTRERPWRDFRARAGVSALDMARRGLGWLTRSQDRSGSGGVASFDFHRWMRGYPEVTGYVIPTFWDYAHRFDDSRLAERAVRMADWELLIQLADGGWEGGNHGDGEPPVVFNTGQVVRGLLRTWAERHDERYLSAVTRAADWIVANQESDGSWAAANFKGMKRVYDSYVSAPLAALAELTGDERYADSARRNCDFVLRHQRPNGWFELCDNSPHYNNAPVTHTVCYTASGLIEAGSILGEDRYVEAGVRAALALAACVDDSGWLPGRVRNDWSPAVSWVCITGSAQLGVLLVGPCRQSGDDKTARVASRLLDFLAYVQQLTSVGSDRSGALAGSYPIWAPYAPLRWPCWSTKYLLDFVSGVLHSDANRGAGVVSATTGTRFEDAVDKISATFVTEHRDNRATEVNEAPIKHRTGGRLYTSRSIPVRHLVTWEGRSTEQSDVLVVTTAWPTLEMPMHGIFVKRQIDALRARGLAIDVLHIHGYRSSLAYFAAARQLVTLRNGSGRYQLVHAQSGEAATIAWLYLRAPVLTTYFGSDVLGARTAAGQLTINARMRARLIRCTAALSGATITQSQQMHDLLPRRLRLRDRVILNGVDLEAFRPLARDAARDALGWPKEDRVALFAGNVPGKRRALATAAVQGAQQGIPNLRLEIAQNVLPDRMPILMSAADCLLHPSASEGSPNVVKEAMACNLPVIATPVGDIPELLRGVSNSTICDPTVSGLAAALVDCLRAGQRSNGRDSAHRFDQRHVVDQLQDVYDRLRERPAGIRSPARVRGRLA